MPCQPAISSMSLGRAWEHALFTKLAEASKAGYSGVEIFYEDLDYLASTNGSSTRENLLKAAEDVRTWCDDFKLEVVCLQPFMFYEGLVDRKAHEKRLEELEFWFELVEVLGTDMILIPSNFGAAAEGGITGEMEVLVGDLREVAEMGMKQNPVVRFAYEALAWGTYVDRWEQVWEAVKRVDRVNFGMCVDSFNIAGRVWADPTARDGKNEGADEEFEASMKRLATQVDVKKIFFAQIVDAERMKFPLVEGHAWFDASQPARMSWSRNARLFAFEEGGYLPIERLLDVLFQELKFQGWVSMELFSRTMADPDELVPESHARRGIASWKKMVEKYGLE